MKTARNDPMKFAELVTFGGTGFDRAAHLRADPAKLEALMAGPEARILPVWRGKPLLRGERERELVFLPTGHKVLNAARNGPVFLGLEGGLAYFAQDISTWEVPELNKAQIGAFIDDSEQHHPDLPQSQVFAELRRNMARLGMRDAELAAMAVGVFAWHRNHRFCARCGRPSEVVSGCWQRICPDCKAPHFPRTDPVVIMLITRGNKLLIGRSPGWPEGMYSLLAGFMEPGETIEAAVRREVAEETGIRVGPVGYLASQPWPFPSSLMIGCWGEAQSEDIAIDETEIEDAIWVSREDIHAAWSAKSPTLVAARKGAIAHFLIKNWLSDTLG